MKSKKCSANIDYSEQLRVDSHKLLYHVERVYRWQKGENIYPLYMEISLSGRCNNRCIFCAFDYLGYQGDFLKTRTLEKFITQAAVKGVKSVLFSGEGEPLLHPDAVRIIKHTRNCGIDVALTTNGTLLSASTSHKILAQLSWLRVSLNAASRLTYEKIHRADPRHFEQILANLREAVRIKRKNAYQCVIGVQFLLLKENCHELKRIVQRCAAVGVDYLIIKPYSQHPKSLNRLKDSIDYGDYVKMDALLQKEAGKKVRVIFRRHTMEKISRQKAYDRCYGMPFWAHVTAEGDIYGCSGLIGDKRFCYGNLYSESFLKIWNGTKRKKIKRMIEGAWDVNRCREVCRLDEINRYLWNLKNPPLHVNFI